MRIISLLQSLTASANGRFIRAVTLACLLSFVVTGCQSPRVMLEAVGPASPDSRTTDGPGKLIVFTAKEQFERGEVSYSQHSSYSILTPDGKLHSFVRNHTDGRDEPPQVVSLPAGSYVVTGTAQGLGVVKVPVVIQALKTTELHLEPGWKPDLTGRGEGELVRLPNGPVAGWRAPVKDPQVLNESKAAAADAIVKVKLVLAPETAGKVAYALVENLAVLRNKTHQPLPERFTVGYRDFTKGVPAGVSVVYLQLVKREAGGVEWLMIDN